MMNERAIQDLIRAARLWAADSVMPWFAPALHAATPMMRIELPTLAAVDRWGRVYFNPRLITHLVGDRPAREVLPEVAFLWYHEIAHLLREHASRAEDLHAQPLLWNIAADLEINDFLPEGLRVPQNYLCLLPTLFNLPDGRTAEYYYLHLRECVQVIGATSSLFTGVGRTATEEEGGGFVDGDVLIDTGEQHVNVDEQWCSQETASKGDLLPSARTDEGIFADNVQSTQEATSSGSLLSSSGAETDSRKAAGKGDIAEEAGALQQVPVYDEGSGVHNEARYWELREDTLGAPALSEFDLTAVRQQVAQEIVKTRGVLPAGWVRWAEEQLKPRVDWRKQLQRVVRGAISDGIGRKLDYSFRRPHRRASVYHPLYLPALYGQNIPHVVCVVDTSGSISAQELSQAMTEVRGVLEQVHARLTVIPCDAVPYEPIEILRRSHLAKLQQDLKGGGGTDMIKGIEAALQLHPEPDAVIVLTDGYTPYPENTYSLPVVFGIFRSKASSDPPLPPTPPWKLRDIVHIPVGEDS